MVFSVGFGVGGMFRGLDTTSRIAMPTNHYRSGLAPSDVVSFLSPLFIVRRRDDFYDGAEPVDGFGLNGTTKKQAKIITR
ncbi:MAG TPA: hypothetical protein QGH84_06505, partial [Rhodospirillales bacterium]|nr:hypothetical protein [Rhodospirillales bacterium]